MADTDRLRRPDFSRTAASSSIWMAESTVYTWIGTAETTCIGRKRRCRHLNPERSRCSDSGLRVSV